MEILDQDHVPYWIILKEMGLVIVMIRKNPAEYILEAIGAGATASTDFDWGEIWAQSPEKYKLMLNVMN